MDLIAGDWQKVSRGMLTPVISFLTKSIRQTIIMSLRAAWRVTYWLR